MLQNNYNAEDFDDLKRKYNLAMINFANIQSNFIQELPKDLNIISRFTDKLSNLNIISGNCYLSKGLKDFKAVESIGIDFNANFNTVQLSPQIQYQVEPKERENRIISENIVSIYNEDKTEIRKLDDLVVSDETICISSDNNSYENTLSLSFKTVETLNNIVLKLNDRTPSYPLITEIYYVDAYKVKQNVTFLMNNKTLLDLNANRNSNNLYKLDIEPIYTDNLQIVFKDNCSDLIIDKLEINYTEYVDKGSLVLEVLKETKPIIKVGLEAKGYESTDFEVSHNKLDWYPINVSNTYTIEDNPKVIAYNTVNTKSIKTNEEVRSLYLRFNIKSLENPEVLQEGIGKEVYRNSSFNIATYNYSNYSLYKNNDSIYYGKLSTSTKLDFKDLYRNGEYVLIDNQYTIKGFVESEISKTLTSKNPVNIAHLKSKAIRKTGRLVEFDDIDISTKELYYYQIRVTNDVPIPTSKVEYVLPMKDEAYKDVYYISQGIKEIKCDLTLGYVNTAIDVLYAVENDMPVYLKNKTRDIIEELSNFEIGEQSVVSLLDSSLFVQKEKLSNTYPIEPLESGTYGLLDNKLITFRDNMSVEFYKLSTDLINTQDRLSKTNTNTSKILSEDEYQINTRYGHETLKGGLATYNLFEMGLMPGGLQFGEDLHRELIEVSYIDGEREFRDERTKETLITIDDFRRGFYTIKLPEIDIIADSLKYRIEKEFIDLKLDINIVNTNKGYSELRITGVASNLPVYVTINYDYNNKSATNLYSVDYSKGILYFSKKILRDCVVNYRYLNIFCKGKSATQLVDLDFNDVGGNINVNEYQEDSTIFFVYKEKPKESRRLTPVLRDIKINYIIKDEMSL